MTKDEALDLALEALEAIIHWYGVRDKNDVMMPPLNQNPEIKESMDAITAIKQARALDKMAENARELGLDYEPEESYTYGTPLLDAFTKPTPVQEPVAYLCENAVGHKYFRWKKPSSEFKPIALYTTPPAQPAPVQERNFCERCGKRLGSGIHTCTPPAAPVQEPDEWLTGCPECGMDSGCDCDSGTWNPPAAQRQWVRLTKTVVGNHLRRHALGDQSTFRQGFKEGVAFAELKLKEKNT